MAKQKVYLSKMRDFGENLGDTFQFIRQEFKPLLRSYTLISGVFMLAAAVLSGFYQMRLWTIIDQVGKVPDNDPMIIFETIFSEAYFLIILITVIATVAMKICVAGYMKLYDRDQQSPSLEEVWSEFLNQILPALGLTLILWVLIIIGLVFCILPGIYLLVVFTPTIMIMVNEDASLGQAFRRSFRLIKDNFWLSLGIYIVAYLIYTFAASAIGGVLGVFAGITSYLTTKELDSTLGLVTSITSIFTYCFYVIFYVSVGLHYFSLAERQDGFGMMRRLETLGAATAPDRTDEQY